MRIITSALLLVHILISQASAHSFQSDECGLKFDYPDKYFIDHYPSSGCVRDTFSFLTSDTSKPQMNSPRLHVVTSRPKGIESFTNFEKEVRRRATGWGVADGPDESYTPDDKHVQLTPITISGHAAFRTRTTYKDGSIMHEGFIVEMAPSGQNKRLLEFTAGDSASETILKGISFAPFPPFTAEQKKLQDDRLEAAKKLRLELQTTGRKYIKSLSSTPK